jgi:hypothetical protein
MTTSSNDWSAEGQRRTAVTRDDRGRLPPFDALIGMLVAAREEMAQLRGRLQSEATVSQAQGIVMGRLDLDAPQARAYLERVSAYVDSSVVDVAADIVLTRELPGISSERLRVLDAAPPSAEELDAP